MNSSDNLRGGSRVRLNSYRAKLARSLETIAKHHAYSVTRSDAYGGVILADSGALDHLREIRGEDQTRDYGRGWYADADSAETITGKVAALPSRKGEPRFIAYAVNSGADGITIDRDVYIDARAACHAADRLAERMAEDEREYSEKWNEARELEDQNEAARERLRELRRRVKNQVAAIRALRVSNDEKAAAYHVQHLEEFREDFAAVLDEMRERRERLAELRAEGIEA